MTRKLVGHGPDHGLRPYVPDIISVELGGSVRSATRKAAVDSPPPLTPCEPVELADGLWPCVGEEGVRLFPLSEEPVWRARAAQDLLASARRAGDPARGIELLRASAAMVGVNMDATVADLEAARRPGEDLVAAYLRTRRRQAR